MFHCFLAFFHTYLAQVFFVLTKLMFFCPSCFNQEFTGLPNPVSAIALKHLNPLYLNKINHS